MRPKAYDLDKKNYYFIKYQPELKEAFGSQEAALLFQRSEYWFEKYSTGFWKFLEPCAHPLYKHGDSWEEELGFSRKVFRRAFSVFGSHYKSKSAYLAQSDPFQGKLYASYYDRKTNRTYFLRNHQGVQEFLSSIWQGVKKAVSKVKAKITSEGNYRRGPSGSSFVRALDISLQRYTSSYEAEQQTDINTPLEDEVAIPDKIPNNASTEPLSNLSCKMHDTTAVTLNPKPVDELNSQSLLKPTQPITASDQASMSLPNQSSTRSLCRSKQRLTLKPESTLNSTPGLGSISASQPQSTSLPSTAREKDKIDKNTSIAQDMLDIWNNITTNKQTLRSDLKITLPKALSESFEGSLELWTEFCKTVASSKFLMGEAPNSKFKAFLAWLIKPDTVQAIREKYYSFGDREVAYVPRSPQLQAQFSRNEVQGSDRWKDICEHLSHKLGYATFRSWFRDIKFSNEESSQPTLHCPTRFMRDWVLTHYQSDLVRIVRQVLPHTTNLEIGVGL